MLVAIVLAPATRVQDDLLYPVDLFVWAWLLRSEDTVDMPVEDDVAAHDAQSVDDADSAFDDLARRVSIDD